MKPPEDTVREQLRHEADEAPDAALVRQRVLADIAELEASGPRRGRTLLVLVAAAAAIVAIAGATLYAASGGLSGDDPEPAGKGAERTNGACIIDRALRSPDDWLNGSSAQDGVEAVGNILRSDYGSLDPLAGLRTGLIGTAIDGANKRLAVVVDPSIIDLQQFQRRLSAAAGNDLVVKVAAGCNSARELIEARQALDSGSDNVIIELSPYDSTWHVWLSPADRGVGDRLTSRTDGLVTIEYVNNPGGRRQ